RRTSHEQSRPGLRRSHGWDLRRNGDTGLQRSSFSLDWLAQRQVVEFAVALLGSVFERRRFRHRAAIIELRTSYCSAKDDSSGTIGDLSVFAELAFSEPHARLVWLVGASG